MQMNHSKPLLTLIIAFLSVTFLSAQTIWYVNDDNASGGDGTSWTTAFNDLQMAITASNIGDQIWIKEGIYKPTNTSERGISFEFKESVEVFGGFPEVGNPIMENRNAVSFPTILSGDIGTMGDNSDNSYHVVYMSGFFCYQNNTTFLNTSLNGLIIQDGNANGDTEVEWHLKRGGGLFLLVDGELGGGFHAGMLINNCVFKNNEAENGGGGMYVRSAFGNTSNFTFANCTFENNKAPNSWGGAVLNDAYSGTNQCNYVNCIFKNNSAAVGAAMGLDGRMKGNCSPNIVNCLFENNVASNSGGALMGDTEAGKIGWNICQSKFISNQALGYAGGALASWGGGTDEGLITDCEFAGNLANNPNNHKNGGAIFFDLSNNVAHTTKIEACSFKNNKSNWNGGAICFFMFGTAQSDGIIQNCYFDGNESIWGGAIHLGGDTNTNLAFSNCQFSHNLALKEGNSGGNGGAISTFTNIKLTECVFSNNQALFSGGAIFQGGQTITSIWSNCKFINNLANQGGGAIRNNANANEFVTPQIVQGIFQGNTGIFNGGAIWNVGDNDNGVCNALIKSATFYDNSANTGKSIHNIRATITMDNSILWAGTTIGGGNTGQIVDDATPSIVSYCLIEDGFAGNSTSMPNFVNASGYNLSLQNGSPGIDIGNNDSLPMNLTKDLIGAERILNNTTDMGAFEHQSSPLSLTLVPKPVTCQGNNDGEILVLWSSTLVDFSCNELTLTIQGANNNSSVKLTANTGIFTLAVHSNFELPAGCYKITLSDCVGKTETSIAYIEVKDSDNDDTPDCEDADCNLPTSVMVQITHPDNCSGMDNGVITIVPTGGSTNLSYSILGRSSYQVSNTFNNRFPGVYDRIFIRNNETNCEMAVDAVVLIGPDCGMEFCTDGVDNDGDGLVDCADTDCAPELFLFSPMSPSCPNGTDGSMGIAINGLQPYLFMSIDGGNTYAAVSQTNDGTFSLENLGAGNYLLKYGLAGGCENAYSFSLLCQDAPPNNDCPDKQTIVGTTTDSLTIQAVDTITSTQIIDSLANMTYKAGKGIVLKAGFEVKTGAIFLATIEDCSNQTLTEDQSTIATNERLQQPTIEATPKFKQPTNFKVFPNPFHNQTTIEFSLPESSTIQINLYNLNGQLVKTVFPHTLVNKGPHQLKLTAKHLNPGVYFLSLQTATKRLTRKLILK